MKKILLLILSVVMLLSTSLVFGACGDKNVIYVNTNAYFAPFEYYDGTKIVGVDVDIMNMVGEKLGKKVKFVNTDFGVIIDNVQKGKKYDCGAAGVYGPCECAVRHRRSRGTVAADSRDERARQPRGAEIHRAAGL